MIYFLLITADAVLDRSPASNLVTKFSKSTPISVVLLFQVFAWVSALNKISTFELVGSQSRFCFDQLVLQIHLMQFWFACFDGLRMSF